MWSRHHRSIASRLLTFSLALALVLGVAPRPVGAVPSYNLTILILGMGTTDPPAAMEPYIYLAETTVEVSATPADNYRFSHWTGDVADPTQATTTVYMDGDKGITAVFIPQYDLLVSIDPPQAQAVVLQAPAGPYDEGTTVTLQANGEFGWTFSHWVGDVDDPLSPNTTILIGSADAAVTAVFIPPVMLTVATEGSGAVSPAPGTHPYPRTPWGLLYRETFETDNGGYLASGWPDTLWQWGEPVTWPAAAAEGDKCWGTNLTGNYPDNADAALTSPAIDLSFLPAGTALTVSWWQAFYLESSWYDHAIAEYRVDDGAWQTMWAWSGGTAQFDWHEISSAFVLTSPGSLQLRWSLVTDYSITYAGYYVDDVRISATGTGVPLEAAPAYGWDFSHWEGNVAQTDQPSTFIVLTDNDEEVTAVFTAQSRTVTVEANPPEGGSVSGEGTYLFDSEATVTAATHPGYEFVNWTMGGLPLSTHPTYTFTVVTDHVLVANFELVDIKCSITAIPSPAGAGSVTGMGIYDAGSPVTLTATPAAGRTFAGWWENGILVSTANPYPFVASQSRTLVADFPWLVVSGSAASLEVPNQRVRLVLPSGATTHTYRVWITPSPLTPGPAGYHRLGPVHEVLFRTPAGGSTGALLQLPGTLSFTYYDYETMGLTPGTPLRLFFHHAGAGLWVPLRSTQDEAARRVSALVGHVTPFALMAESSPLARPVVDAVPGVVAAPALTVTGQVAVGATATLYLNDQPQALVVGADGGFQAALQLASGPNHFFVVESKDGKTLASYEERVVLLPVNFADIAGHWAEDYILQLAARGITAGYPGATPGDLPWFGPNLSITRGEFVVMLMRALGHTTAAQPVTFTDAASIPGWMLGYVGAAVEAGIVTGYDDNTFRPGETITRAELAVLVARALALLDLAAAPGTTPAFTDLATIPDWAQAAVTQVAGHGIVTGYPDGTFRPAGLASRAEAAAMLVRMLNLL